MKDPVWPSVDAQDVLRRQHHARRSPDFDGAVCAERGCGRRPGLEWDHDDPLAHGGPTSYANLKPRSWPDHKRPKPNATDKPASSAHAHPQTHNHHEQRPSRRTA
jgi:hypothetical protein